MRAEQVFYSTNNCTISLYIYLDCYLDGIRYIWIISVGYYPPKPTEKKNYIGTRYSQPTHNGACMIYALACVLRKTMERKSCQVQAWSIDKN